MSTSSAPPAVSEVDTAMIRMWEDHFVPSAGLVQKREDDWARVVENDGFDMRGPVGQLWAQDLKSTPQLREQNANVGTKHADQARFRIAWTKTQLEDCFKEEGQIR